MVGLVTDLGAAEDDDEVWAELAEEGDEFGGGADIPDVDADADEGGVEGEDLFGDVDGALVDVEFADGGVGLEFGEVGEEVAQAEGGVGITGVEGGEEDGGGHGGGCGVVQLGEAKHGVEKWAMTGSVGLGKFMGSMKGV